MGLSRESQYIEIVEHIYCAAIDDKQWSPVLDEMADMFGAVGVDIVDGFLSFHDKRASACFGRVLKALIPDEGGRGQYGGA